MNRIILTMATITTSMFTLIGSAANVQNIRSEQNKQAINKVEVTTFMSIREREMTSIPTIILLGTNNSVNTVVETVEERITPELTTVYYPKTNTTMKNTVEGITTKTDIPAGTHLISLDYKEGLHLVNYRNESGWISEDVLASGDVWLVDGTIIANKGYGMSDSFNPGVNPEALSGFHSMKKDAKMEGITLNDFSTFRTYQRQKALYGSYVNKHGRTTADTFSARPGNSEHQSGLAFDIGGANSNLWTSTKLGDTKEGKWMADNAHRYGFILRYPKGAEPITGYQYEPWHFRFVGVPLAEKIYESGLTLDEYYDVVLPDYTN